MLSSILSLWLALSGKTPRRPTPRRRPAFRRPAFRPRVEAMEDRCVPSAAGSLDPTFGSGAGYVTTSFSGGSIIAHAVLVQPDGKIVTAGKAQTSAGYDAAVERYNPDGSLDTSFGSGGIALANLGQTSSAGWAALYPQAGTANDGKIVQQGLTTTGKLFIVRYNTNGSLDTTFGTSGEVTTAIPGAEPGGIVVTSTGQIVEMATGAAAGDVYLVRYNANGTLDSTFGQGGEVITSGFNNLEHPETLLQQPDGKLIAVIEDNFSHPSSDGVELARYTANGSLDTSFGNQGKETLAFDGSTRAGALYPTAGTPNDGKIVIAEISNSTLTWGLVRLNTDGSLDTSFGNDGQTVTPIGGAPNAVAVDASGRILETGQNFAHTSTQLARFNPDGTLDTSFGNGGLVTTTVGTSSDGWTVATYPSAGTANDGKIVVAGLSVSGSTENVLVARYLPQATSPYFVITGPSSITAGTAGTYTISVHNTDGSADTGYSGTVHITSSDPHAVLPSNFTITGSSATFSATLKTAGVQSLTATDTVTSGINGSDAAITVTPASASQFLLSAPSSVSKGSKFSVTLTVEDAYGNVVTGYTGTVHFTSSDSTATLPANYTFTAADAGVHTFTNAAILKKKGTQTITVTDIVNSALTATDDINVS